MPPNWTAPLPLLIARPTRDCVNHYFVNGRVGNTRVHPITGTLIAQMWVH
jgi:hypothetical protein